MAEDKKLFPSTDVDFEVIQDGQFVALRFRSQNGEPSHAVVPVELLKSVYANIPTVLAMAKDSREKAGVAEPASKVTLPQLHNLTRIEFGLLDNDAEQVCLILELNHALKMPTKANRTFLKNALAFVSDKMAETEPKTA
jgi:hypothetical protein